MTCIPNGFDRLNLPDAPPHPERFTIMHVGDFYRSRTPARLLEALASLNNSDIEFIQVGPWCAALESYKDRVRIRHVDRVVHAEALALMQTASLLYLAQGWEAGVTEYVSIASKTYEYLATGVPILADCPPGDNADLVRRYAPRAWVVTSMSIALIEAAVREAYASRTAAHPPGIGPSFVHTFNRRRLTGDLAAVLDAASGHAVDYAAPRLLGSVPFGPRAETTFD